MDCIDLSGKWKVQLKSVKNQTTWIDSNKIFDLNLPGSLTTNNIGEEISLKTPWMGSTGKGGWKKETKYAPYRKPGAIKIPFWLQPIKYYKGPAWYRRTIEIPPTWENKRISLFLERCHWTSRVWIDNIEIGTFDSLGTPHIYSLPENITRGFHEIIICINNEYQMQVGINASSVTDHTQTNWNGIIGKMELQATDKIWMDEIQVYSQIAEKSLQIDLTIQNLIKRPCKAILKWQASSITTNSPQILNNIEIQELELRKQTEKFTISYKLGENIPWWDEFTPNLIRLNFELKSENFSDLRQINVGFRSISTLDHQLLLNNHPIFMRGTLDCCTFPKTGFPATDVQEWTRIFRICKDYGLNHVRFHSWCPPEAAFIAADRIGIYLQVECGIWWAFDSPRKAKSFETFLEEESNRILKNYGNHPSFVFFVHGNEPDGSKERFLREWTTRMKNKDPRHLVCGSAHYTITPENDYHNAGVAKGYHLRYHQEFDKNLPNTVRNYVSQIQKENKPFIAHEVGEWCVFPNMDEIQKYTGILKANNFEIVRDFLKKKHLLDQAKAFFMASGKFQTLIYKEEIEAFLRTPYMGGFQLLGLNDFPGQGTALEGVLDAFWEAKDYVKAEEFRQFSGSVVPLALMKKRVWKNNEIFQADVKIAQFSNLSIKNVKINWSIVNQAGIKEKEGQFSIIEIAQGNDNEIGNIQWNLNNIQEPGKYNLKISIMNTEYQNQWSFWVFNASVSSDTLGTVIVSSKKQALVQLELGNRVLLIPHKKDIRGKTFGNFEPIFWNTAWFPSQKPHTLGLLCDPKHPLFSRFPTDFHADFQWWEVMKNSKPMVLDFIPHEVHPIVQPIDDWNTCRKLGLIFESNLIDGKINAKILVCSVDLFNIHEDQIVLKQLKRSILDYMNSSNFNPTTQISIKDLKTIIK